MDIKPNHLKLITDILQLYPYTFYAFGSRATNKAKPFSDLDLCFFEDIPTKALLKLEEELEESDLPYKVDIVNWHGCDDDFKEIIFKNMACMQASDKLIKIEKNTFNHFKYLPKLVGIDIKEMQSLAVINCGLGSSMFNIAYNTCFEESIDLEQQINIIINEFNNQPFAWWLGPSVASNKLQQQLLQHGFSTNTNEYAMLCDLNKFTNHDHNSSNFVIEQILTLDKLEHFIEIIEPCDTTAQQFYRKLNDSTLCKQEKLFVGYENHAPVVIGTLFCDNDTAGIFNLITKADKRNLGYGTQMMNYLMDYAKKNGASYATLLASSDSGYRLYRHLGFKTLGKFDCFEWK